MALIKAHIVESVAKKCGYTKQKSADITETILELIKKSLESLGHIPSTQRDYTQKV